MMDKRIYLRFFVFELSKSLKYETYSDNKQWYFGRKNIELHYVDTDSFVISKKTADNIQDLFNLEVLFDFPSLNIQNKLLSNEDEKVIGRFKIEKLFGKANLFL